MDFDYFAFPVGSQETKRGCEKINEIRKDKRFAELEIILINLVDDTCHEVTMVEETKISSSNKRIRLLGEHLNCLLYTSPSPRDGLLSRMPSSA